MKLAELIERSCAPKRTHGPHGLLRQCRTLGHVLRVHTHASKERVRFVTAGLLENQAEEAAPRIAVKAPNRVGVLRATQVEGVLGKRSSFQKRMFSGNGPSVAEILGSQQYAPRFVHTDYVGSPFDYPTFPPKPLSPAMQEIAAEIRKLAERTDLSHVLTDSFPTQSQTRKS